jgi:hypothetical protein
VIPATVGWLSRARPVEEPVLEVGFVVWEDVYYGPENGFSLEQWQTLREPLYRPALEFHHVNVDRVFTRALERSTGELARYYADVLRLAAKHGRPPERSSFWLSPFILLPGEPAIQFSWHDTREDAERFFDALESTPEGVVYGDIEEGWDLKVLAWGGRLFVRHGDFSTGEERACFSCDREALVRQVAPLRARLNRILAELRAVLGGDYWSRGDLD